MENKDELKEIDTKNLRCYYFDDIIKVIDICSKNILLDEKIYKDILIYDISSKTLWVQNHCGFGSIK